MDLNYIKEKVNALPTTSGVYIMKDKDLNIIYIGKAKNLKNRVSQYFINNKKQIKVSSMVKNVFDFDYILTNSELDALLLECNLIKKHQPYYNILLKDGKNFPYIRIDFRQDFPKLEIVRKLKKDKAKYFGPYFSGVSAGEIIKAINFAYPIRICNRNIKEGKPDKKDCLYHSLGLCSAPCIGKITKLEYAEIMDKVCDFLNGKDETLYEILQQKMQNAVNLENFELAIKLRDTSFMLDRLKDRTVATLTKVKDVDIFGFAENEVSLAVSVLIVRSGKMIGEKNYNIIDTGEGREEILSSFLTQYYMENFIMPKQILLPFECDEVTNKFLNSTTSIEILVPKKGVNFDLIKQANSNASEFLYKSIESETKEYNKSIGAIEELKNKLGLRTIPHRMECYDISNISGTNSVCSMTVFINGKKASSHYRRFKIKTVKGPNDFASLKEAISRRLERLGTKDISFGSIPNLIVIDGGKGQIGTCRDMIKVYNSDIDVISLAEREEEVFVEDNKESIILSKDSFGLRLLQAIRDEAHRFALTYHRLLRAKAQTESVLDEIDGLGKVKKKALLEKFKSVKKIKEASLEELTKVSGISLSLANKIKNKLNN